jgi:peptidoglycan hydrolase CwlO-like protein
MNYPAVEAVLAADKSEKDIKNKLTYHVNKLYDLQSRRKEWGGEQWEPQIKKLEKEIQELKKQLPEGTTLDVKPTQTTLD